MSAATIEVPARPDPTPERSLPMPSTIMHHDPSPLRPAAALAFALLLLTPSIANAQDGVPPPPGLVPEQMWWAPTAEDWQKPVLIQWQRTWEDAVAVSRETRRPILVCINMDGEIASEHYAGVRYRDPEKAKLYEPYVCVIASVYRHNPRDYDEQGRRIPCPRFGGVTCGEHIAIEPLLYEKFMDGRRISPRHIMVELDGSETYDVFYMWDTDSVFTAIRAGIEQRKVETLPLRRGDLSIVERVRSRDSADRAAVEDAFARADAATRRSLLEAAQALGADAPVELLRLSAFGFDLDLAKQARAAMTQASQPGAVELVAETLRMPIAERERQDLISALERLGTSSPKAKMLATVHRGLDGRQAAVDVARWSQALAPGTYRPAYEPEAVLQRADAAAAAGQRLSADGELALAEATLEQALAEVGSGPLGRRQADRFQQLRFADAQRSALAAAQLGKQDWRIAAVQALCAFHSGDYPAAYQHAEKAAAAMPPDAPGRIAAGVMAVFAEARQEAIAAAVKQKQDWPPQWMSDVHAAYSVLLRHPYGTDQHVAWHWDFLQFFQAVHADQVLEAGLQRFPDSPLLHERLRRSILAARDADALEAAYEQRFTAAPSPALAWFAGYASLVAAETWRRNRQADQALAAYDRALGWFERSTTDAPQNREQADRHAALALAGKARILLQHGDLEPALELVEAALARRPDAAATPDGLNITAVDTARMLRARLAEQKLDPLVQRLDAALARLDPALLAAPEYEREGRRGRGGRRRGG